MQKMLKLMSAHSYLLPLKMEDRYTGINCITLHTVYVHVRTWKTSLYSTIPECGQFLEEEATDLLYLEDRE